MREVFYILLVLLSAASLFSFSLYLYLLIKRDSDFLIVANQGNLKHKFKEKAFLVLAIIGLFVCMYQGADALLWWMPDEWGSIGEDGDYNTYRSSLAALFSMVAGGGLIALFADTPLDQWKYRVLSNECTQLEAIIDASIHTYNIASLKEKFEKARAEITVSGEYDGRYSGVFSKSNSQHESYGRLIRLLEGVEKSTLKNSNE